MSLGALNTTRRDTGFTAPHDQSVIFDTGASMTRTFTTTTGDSGAVWLKRTSFGTTQNIWSTNIQFNTSDQLVAFGLTSTRVFRDIGWFHILWNSSGVYFNGEIITGTGTYSLSAVANPVIGGSANRFNGVMSEFHYGTSTTFSASSFLQDFTFGDGTIKAPKAVTGLTYGTNGFKLTFSNSSNFGEDSSGNTNNFTPTGFVAADQVTDVPGDPYAIMDPLIQAQATPITDGGRGWGNTANTEVKASSIVVPSGSGRYYCEMEYTSGSVGNVGIGVYQTSYNFGAAAIFGVGSVVYLAAAGNKVVDGSTTAYGSSWIITARIGILLDTDADTVEFYNEGVAQGAIALAAGQDWHFGAGQNAAPGRAYYASSEWETTPTDVKELKASNLPTPEFNGQDYFGVNTRTGTGAAFSVTGAGNKGELVISKSRSAATGWVWADIVSGTGKYLQSSSTAVEVTDAQSVTSFDVDGYSGGTATILNNSGQTYVDYMFEAGGTAVTNTDGSITSTVSAHPSGHFSTLTYVGNATLGATIGHGINKPDLIILKNRSFAAAWLVYNSVDGPTFFTQLNTTGGRATGFNVWNSTEPTSTVFTVGNIINDNSSGHTFSAFCFANTPGLLKVGGYTGNGSTNGPFIHCGFKPRWVLIKQVTLGGQYWLMLDSARDRTNPLERRLYANDPLAESIYSNTKIDFLAGGFKCRGDYAEINASGHGYIYLAIAEEAGGGTLPFPLGR